MAAEDLQMFLLQFYLIDEKEHNELCQNVITLRTHLISWVSTGRDWRVRVFVSNGIEIRSADSVPRWPESVVPSTKYYGVYHQQQQTILPLLDHHTLNIEREMGIDLASGRSHVCGRSGCCDTPKTTKTGDENLTKISQFTEVCGWRMKNWTQREILCFCWVSGRHFCLFVGVAISWSACDLATSWSGKTINVCHLVLFRRLKKETL